VVDLGCGDGRFGDRLREHHPAGIYGLDRSRGPHVRAAAIADVDRPPLRDGGCGLLVAANLLRHLPHPAAAVAAWRRALRPDGVLWILEDEPAAAAGPGGLYRDLQGWLVRHGPPGRGALLPQRRARELLDDGPGWRWGGFVNQEALRDPAALLAGLRAAAAGGDAAAAVLADRLERESFAYGEAWWARWQQEAVA